MFDTLTDKLTAVFNRVGSKGRLTDEDIDEALREVRLALLEADVNFRVARDFTAKVKERATGSDVLRGISPGQQVVKLVHDQLVELLGEGNHTLTPGPVAARHAHARGAAGFRQDDGRRETCAAAAQARGALAAHRRRPAASGSDRPVGGARQAVGYPRLP